MLYGTPTRKGTGIVLHGDYYDLHHLHETVHRLAEPLDRANAQPQHGALMNFAYEVRHARDGTREKRQTSDAGLYYGFGYTWPDLLIVTNVLRSSATWHPTQDRDHAMLYLLEASIRAALRGYDARGAEGLGKLVGTGLATSGPLLDHLQASVTVKYLLQPANKVRFRALPALMHNYLTLGNPAHEHVTAQVRALAALEGCAIEQIEVIGWPDKVIW